MLLPSFSKPRRTSLILFARLPYLLKGRKSVTGMPPMPTLKTVISDWAPGINNHEKKNYSRNIMRCRSIGPSAIFYEQKCSKTVELYICRSRTQTFVFFLTLIFYLAYEALLAHLITSTVNSLNVHMCKNQK